MNFAPMTFWYARPGVEGNVQPDPKSAILPVAKQRGDVVPVRQVPDAIEGESLKIVERTGGETSVQAVGKFNWSGGAQLWWIDGKPGEELTLDVPVQEAGRYRVTVDLTKAPDYGVVRLKLADGPAKEFDRYHASVANDALELGSIDLKKGSNRLTIEIVGANEKAISRHMFGLDYLKVDAVQ